MAFKIGGMAAFVPPVQQTRADAPSARLSSGSRGNDGASTIVKLSSSGTQNNVSDLYNARGSLVNASQQSAGAEQQYANLMNQGMSQEQIASSMQSIMATTATQNLSSASSNNDAALKLLK